MLYPMNNTLPVGHQCALIDGYKLVLVNAPAGCGKTHFAADLAVARAPTLERGQRVLMLSHTNIAVEEFERRARRAGAAKKIYASTLASFLMEIVRPYVDAYGLPRDPDYLFANQTRLGGYFNDIETSCLALLQKNKSVGRLLAKIFPLVVVDEHQDSNARQHGIIMEIARYMDVQLRVLADPMQNIIPIDALIEWDLIREEFDSEITLTIPHRWHSLGAKELGEWIMLQRESLQSIGRIDETALCPRVRVLEAEFWDIKTIGNLIRDCKTWAEHEMGCADHLFLAPTNAQAKFISRSTGYTVPEREYAHLNLAREIAALVTDERLSSDARRRVAFRELRRVAYFREDLVNDAAYYLDNGVWKRDEWEEREQKFIDIWQPALDLLRRDQTSQAFRQALQLLLKRPFANRVWQREAARLLAYSGASLEKLSDPKFFASVRSRSRIGRRNVMQASTIHKAKGSEADNIIAFISRNISVEMQYVAISRAKKALTVVFID